MFYRFIVRLMITLCSVAALHVGAASLEAQVKDCEGCHGPDGVSQCPDMPTIAGVSIASHEEAMFAYLDGLRPCEKSDYRHGDTSRAATDMCTVAKALSEDDIAALAEYFADKKFVAMKQTTDAGKAKAGEAVHEAECKLCHSDGGSNPEDDAGILAGQPMGYLKKAFKEYRSETREQPKKMKSKIDALSDEDIDALVHFYASQQ
ncbi:MAG: cytochrome c-553 [Gammaproteobacteria bacterium]|nr:cytochrome c-553 [Gammaproteobacteria bacterium]